MAINDGFGHVGDTIRFPAVFPDENGNRQTGLSPTISFKILTASVLLVEDVAMTEDSELSGVYYYEYTPASPGVYFAVCVCPGQVDQFSIYVIGDGATENLDVAVSTRATPQAVWEYSQRALTTFGTLINDIWAFATRTLTAFGFQVNTDISADIPNLATSADVAAVPANVWSHSERSVTTGVGITEEEFHLYLQSYPEFIPAGETPALPVPPGSTAVVMVYKYLRQKDDSVLTSATPTCQLLDYTTADNKAYYIPKEAMTFNSESGLAQILVPPNCRIRVIIPEVGLDEVGWTGAGGTTIEADALYAERQI